MTPLVDIVMVILIFLMLAGQFGGLEHYLISKLPYSEVKLGGSQSPTRAVPDEPLDVRVDSPSADKWVAQIGDVRTENASELAAVLTRIRESLIETGMPAEQLQLIISPARQVRYEYLMQVYQAAMDARFEKIAFARSHE